MHEACSMDLLQAPLFVFLRRAAWNGSYAGYRSLAWSCSSMVR